METKVFKTTCQTEREARDMAIYNERPLQNLA